MTWQTFAAAPPVVGTGQGPYDSIVVYAPPTNTQPAVVMASAIAYALALWGGSSNAYWDTLEVFPTPPAITPSAAVQAAITQAQAAGNTALVTALQSALSTVAAHAVGP